MAGQQAGHGLDHVERVLHSARLIQAEVGGDRCVVELAALLHDVGDAKFHDGVERSAEFAREILGQLGANDELIEHVAKIVDNISFRKGVASDTLSLEGKIVQDADRLDALGAIGIVRTIEYGAVMGQPFFMPGDESQKTGVGHFHEKLFKLKALLNTEPARRLAGQREQFMRTFLDQFLRESQITA
ncbi:HD domain-containing protein [Stieleria sp. TO1_6]|uniref:HD domain-containing protein n=1 Tax=Stieleria tagensis TaxID=2956795 RepID=UPI00209BA88C|nr:HD domain-containing protein [Stieleria tagensis]MCO8123201.1 HD domain-containing protein [Stieleria tagensis]